MAHFETLTADQLYSVLAEVSAVLKKKMMAKQDVLEGQLKATSPAS